MMITKIVIGAVAALIAIILHYLRKKGESHRVDDKDVS